MYKDMKKENTAIQVAVKRKLAREFGVSYRFVGMCISRDRDSPTAERITEAYRKLLKQAEELLG